MLFRVLIGILLLSFGFAVTSRGQEQGQRGMEPVTKREVRRLLNATQDDPHASELANKELIAAIHERGVNFALSSEEEWSFQLLDASDELLEAIRSALSPEQRESILNAADKRRLYFAFADNYRQNNAAGLRSAVDAGREFVRRFSDDESVREVVVFMNRTIPQLERTLMMLERNIRGGGGRRPNN